MPSNHLILCHPLLLQPSIFPSIRVFSNESVRRIKWPKYWSFSFNISPSNEHSGLISFRMDWFHLLARQGTLKSLLQHHSSKTSILRQSPFFIVQLSHLYVTTGKNSFDYMDLCWQSNGPNRSRRFSPYLRIIEGVQFSSVAQSCPTLQLHELQHARPPCPSPTPGVHSNSCPSSQ